jgi:hypothetical protein
MVRRLCALVIVPAAIAAGCGSSAPPGAATPTPVPGGDVVRAWSDALRHGDVDAATDRFAIPAVVANGTPEIQLKTRAEVRFFNQTLPCGSRVTGIVPHHGALIVSFVLTDRPGGNCGDGVGKPARVAMVVRGGRIVRWLRLDVGREPQTQLT